MMTQHTIQDAPQRTTLPNIRFQTSYDPRDDIINQGKQYILHQQAEMEAMRAKLASYEGNTFTQEDLRVTMEAVAYEQGEAQAEIAQLKQQLEIQTLKAQLAEKEAEVAKKTKATRPKKEKVLGANVHLQKNLQEQGTLAPFRFGGCRCRTWSDKVGVQCGKKAITEAVGKDGEVVVGLCNQHAKKITDLGSWQLGMYDQPRPEVWGEGGLHTPKWEKVGRKIPWIMKTDVYKEAFALSQGGAVSLDVEAPVQRVEVVEVVEVEEEEQVLVRQDTLELPEVREPMPGDPDFVPPVGLRVTLDTGVVLERTEEGCRVVDEEELAMDQALAESDAESEDNADDFM
jgi:hypothetical protein